MIYNVKIFKLFLYLCYIKYLKFSFLNWLCIILERKKDDRFKLSYFSVMVLLCLRLYKIL